MNNKIKTIILKKEVKMSKAQDQVFDIIFDKDEITWQTILYDLVKTEQMDPWDIDVSLLTNKFLNMLNKFKEMDFKISGKVLLAATILLKIKSKNLVGKDLARFDNMMSSEEPEDEFYEEFTDAEQRMVDSVETPSLIPRTPQPRKRKVSIYDLVGALQKALDVKKRRVLHSIPSLDIELPEKKINISGMIGGVYNTIISYFSKNQDKLTFSKLIPSESKQDKVYTFIPLLHLTNQRKVDIHQEEHFGDIEIIVRTKKALAKEMSAKS
jgi:segregation and condensation protein A